MTLKLNSILVWDRAIKSQVDSKGLLLVSQQFLIFTFQFFFSGYFVKVYFIYCLFFFLLLNYFIQKKSKFSHSSGVQN